MPHLRLTIVHNYHLDLLHRTYSVLLPTWSQTFLFQIKISLLFTKFFLIQQKYKQNSSKLFLSSIKIWHRRHFNYSHLWGIIRVGIIPIQFYYYIIIPVYLLSIGGGNLTFYNVQKKKCRWNKQLLAKQNYKLKNIREYEFVILTERSPFKDSKLKLQRKRWPQEKLTIWKLTAEIKLKQQQKKNTCN